MHARRMNMPKSFPPPIAVLLIVASIAFTPSAATEEQDFPLIPFDVLRHSLNIVMTVQDGHAMREFYGGVLGLREIPPLNMPDGSTMIRFLGGRSEIKIIVANEKLPQHPGGTSTARGIRALTLYIPENSGVLKRLKEHGYDTSDFDRNDQNLYVGAIRDPEDNEIELKLLPFGSDKSKLDLFEIRLTVDDIHESRLYYGKMLRLKEIAPIPGDDDKPTTYRFQAGTTILNISKFDKGLPAYVGHPLKGNGFRTMQFLVSDADAVHDVLEARGAKVADLFTLGKLARTLYLADPDGVYVEFASPPDKL